MRGSIINTTMRSTSIAFALVSERFAIFANPLPFLRPISLSFFNNNYIALNAQDGLRR